MMKSNAWRRAKTLRTLAESAALFFGLALLANLLGPQAGRGGLPAALYLAVLAGQGLALQRLYILAHEAAHKKVWQSPWANDLVGQIALVPLLTPLQIFRSIHYFHHGFNRRDYHTSALDVMISPWPVTPLVYAGFYLVWFAAVFLGGFFIHSLVSIVLFLCLPLKVARRVSPAFRQWSGRDCGTAWLQFLAALSVHLAAAWLLGPRAWLYSLGLPLLSFAWIWSCLVYVFHYNTTLGEPTRYNARSIRVSPFSAWLLMNFNHHAVHHMFPNLPWHDLPGAVPTLPAPYPSRNREARSLLQAVLAQLQGPTLVYQGKVQRAPQPAPPGRE
jgi:fatty acid desaturase